MTKAAKKLRGRRDMISSLPDCLLHLIMSFLTTREAVQTCVLSKRWKDLWITLPFLDFDWRKFKYYTVSDDRELKAGRFRNFVNVTLLLREAFDLHTFRLYCPRMPIYLDNMFEKSWIRYALKHSPQVLAIDIFMTDSLPHGVFSCSSLVDLSLSTARSSKNNIEVIDLPCLKRLHLEYIFVNQDFVEKLFCGCPRLEFLHLQRCGMELSSICSQSLKHLKVEGNCRQFDGTENIMKLIDAPNLLSFEYRRCTGYVGQKMLLNMPSLMSADICLGHCLCYLYNGKSNIFVGIASVESLKLAGFCLKHFMKNELPICPMFWNVKDLYVNNLCLSCHFDLLASFLDHFPNLKKLSLYNSDCFCKVKAHGMQESLKVAPFRCKQLETVDVRFSKCDKNFHWVMKYLQDATEDSRARINMISGY